MHHLIQCTHYFLIFSKKVNYALKVALPNTSNLYIVRISQTKPYVGKCVTTQHDRESNRDTTFTSYVKKAGNKYTVEYLQIESRSDIYDEIDSGVASVAETLLLLFYGNEKMQEDFLNDVSAPFLSLSLFPSRSLFLSLSLSCFLSLSLMLGFRKQIQ